jgi:hypothetical protein
MSEMMITQKTEQFEPEHTLGEYNGNAVRCRSVNGVLFLSATDMCQAAGKRWNKYNANQQTQEFIAKLSEDLRCPNSGIVISLKGGQGEQGTWVHEDLAYHLAMWCSPEFQLWCIRQIKALTQGKPVHREIAEAHVDTMGLLNRVAELLHSQASESYARDMRIEVKFDKHAEEVRNEFSNVHQRLDEIQTRRNLSEATKANHCRIVSIFYSGKCPCCQDVRIIDECGFKIPNILEYDHWLSKTQPGLSQTWPVCKSCNTELKKQDVKAAARSFFETYQKRRSQLHDRPRVRCLPGMEDAR